MLCATSISMSQYTHVDVQQIRSRHLLNTNQADPVLIDLAAVCDALEQTQKAVEELAEAKKTIWRLLSPPKL